MIVRNFRLYMHSRNSRSQLTPMGSSASSGLGGNTTYGSRIVRCETEPEQARPSEETNMKSQSLFPVNPKSYMMRVIFDNKCLFCYLVIRWKFCTFGQRSAV